VLTPESGEGASSARRLRRVIGRIPFIGYAARLVWTKAHNLKFRTSGEYWESRYAAGGNSGAGSYGRLALWKAEVLNRMVRENEVSSIIEFGCGDGAQLSLATYPSYIGIDVAPSAVRLCIDRFRGDSSKSFFAIDPRAMADPLGVLRADMALSLDVLYHLVEDDVRDTYLTRLFQAATRYVVIYSSDGPAPTHSAHERHRPFTPWIAANAQEWRLIKQIRNPYHMSTSRDDQLLTSPADFFVYARNSS
jgi:hypothetical protein